MTKGCLDEGVLQGYIDGELSQDEMSGAASHIAACESCAASLATAESDAAFFSSAFALDTSVSIPTEALRARINAAVAQLESASETKQERARGKRFGGFLASLSGLFNFTPQSVAAFASLLVVVALVLIFFVAHRSNPAPTENHGAPLIASSNPSHADSFGATPMPDVARTNVESHEGNDKIKVLKAVHRRSRASNGAGVTTPAEKGTQLLPGEKDYQTAISSLEQTIKLGGDATLRPAVRVDYERNLAILDSAIDQTRQVAARNPKDKDAVGFLMSAYQSKVELLTKVADQAQVAALGR